MDALQNVKDKVSIENWIDEIFTPNKTKRDAVSACDKRMLCYKREVVLELGRLDPNSEQEGQGRGSMTQTSKTNGKCVWDVAGGERDKICECSNEQVMGM